VYVDVRVASSAVFSAIDVHVAFCPVFSARFGVVLARSVRIVAVVASDALIIPLTMMQGRT